MPNVLKFQSIYTSRSVKAGREAGFLSSSREHDAWRIQTLEPAPSLPVIVETKNVPIYLYTKLEEVEPEALQQLIALAESPLPVGFVSAMPDVHLGKGATIGSVWASDKYIAASAVGVDIGCGMCAVPMQGLHKDDLSLDKMKRIQKIIKHLIPTGFNMHEQALPSAGAKLDEISQQHPPSRRLEQAMQQARVKKQLSTLGGGNHFLEVVHDDEGMVWIMLHSGSRNIGNTTALYYDKIAAEQLAAANIKPPSGLNYLAIESADGQAYLQDMTWCQGYAAVNRQLMLERMITAVNSVTGAQPDNSRIINIHHNYCECERCSYKDPRTGEEVVDRPLYVTRKGATSARPGQLGIIPGSMGVGSYITRGIGEARAWNSSSHGAGRLMSRTKARATIKQEDFEQSMAGIVCDTDEAVRDEAPAAYKDLTTVMANQRDLVEVVHKLQPLINVKGFDKPWGFKRRKGQRQ
ncbi:hypothetical protein WJX72_001958 [[Myrmecia] bisecta]|uniref:3'-phosphate/5'-hydroxy nucleic acid ligase n=1 Tax=[Myrmecia] bisecta TaxID=41462 RepID=A0AAW1R5E2_9CHLO